jgi:surface protein
VQSTGTATTKWGGIGDWDVSGVGDFSFAFSKYRDQAGGSWVNNGNPKAVSFVGTGLAKWDTTSITTLASTFYGASAMNSDLSAWKVGKVKALIQTFYDASKFVGTGLNLWDTASVTTLHGTFAKAGEMNSDLSAWKVGKVKTLASTFYDASKFVGTGLNLWDTASVTTLYLTFANAGAMNSDLSAWKVGKVETLEQTFYKASKFVGTGGLSKWDTSSVNNLDKTFWDANSLTSCNKRQIADAWKPNTAFTSSTHLAGYQKDYTTWASDTCPVPCSAGSTWSSSGNTPCSPCAAASTCAAGVKTACAKTANTVCTPWVGALTDIAFKQASWDWVQGAVAAATKWGELEDWDVSVVEDFSFAFSTGRNEAGDSDSGGNPKAATFVGTGLDKWITSSVTTLAYTFYAAGEMNSDLSKWSVGKTTTLEATFGSASKFIGTGLSSWDTASATSLSNTFEKASEMNSDLSKWNVAKVTTLSSTFSGASTFIGAGLASWDVANVISSMGFSMSCSTTMGTFDSVLSFTSCNKRKIADAWKSSAAFTATTYDTDWAADTCVPCTAGSTWSSSGNAPCATCAAACVAGVKTACTKTTDIVCNDGPCAAGMTFSASGNTPCAACEECTAGAKTTCTTMTDTVCNVSLYENE